MKRCGSTPTHNITYYNSQRSRFIARWHILHIENCIREPALQTCAHTACCFFLATTPLPRNDRKKKGVAYVTFVDQEARRLSPTTWDNSCQAQSKTVDFCSRDHEHPERQARRNSILLACWSILIWPLLEVEWIRPSAWPRAAVAYKMPHFNLWVVLALDVETANSIDSSGWGKRRVIRQMHRGDVYYSY